MGTADVGDRGAVSPRRRRLTFVRRLGVIFHAGTVATAAALVAFVAGFVYLLARGGVPSLDRFGGAFLLRSEWSVPTATFGGWPGILGTLLTSGLAVLFAVPVALGVALFATEFAPRRVRASLAYFLDLGAAIPSVIYGFWGFAVLVPFLRDTGEPTLARALPGLPIVSGPILGTDVLAASLVLAIMILPTIAALTREALRAVPRAQREGALGLGATRWEAVRMTVLGSAFPGIVGAVVLGLGRAVGETIAVALVIGNTYAPAHSLFSPAVTIPSWLVARFAESGGLERSALFELALLLFAISLALNVGARLLLRRRERRPRAGSRRAPLAGSRPRSRPVLPADPGRVAAPSWWARVERSRSERIRRRHGLQLVVLVLAGASVVVAALPIASLVGSAVAHGGSAVVRPSFYTSGPPIACGLQEPQGCPLGGIGPEIEGTLVLLALGAAAGVPAGILAGIYLSEYGRRRFGHLVGLVVDALLGMPTILLGIVVFAIFLRFDRPDAQSALAGAVALAVLMVPIVARATESALRSVPATVREAALALGFPRHRVTLRVVLGSARGAVVTGSLLAVMRAGGETAALVLTAGVSTYWLTNLGAPAPALGPFIFDALTVYGGSPNYVADAWGAALVLLLIMVAVSLAARLLLEGKGEGSPE